MVPPRTDSTVNNEAVHTGLNRFAYRTPKQQNPRRSGGSSGANKNRTCDLILIRDALWVRFRSNDRKRFWIKPPPPNVTAIAAPIAAHRERDKEVRTPPQCSMVRQQSQ